MTRRHQHGFLTWNAPGTIPQVRLYHDVIDRMTIDVMRGFGVTRRRGTEVGGVLLGKVNAGDQPEVLIYDYEAVPCEYAQGPSYVLSERDLQAFRDAVARWRNDISPDQYVVGYFRSHTRERLYLDETDVELFHQHVNNPLGVALVVKPYATRSSEAAFFLQSDGKLETQPHPPEFQFIRAESAVPKEARLPSRNVAVPTPVPEEEEDEADVDAEADVAPPPPPPTPPASATPALVRRPEPVRPAAPIFGTYYPPQQPSWRSRALWIVFTIAAFAFGGVVGYEYAGGQILGLRTPMPATSAKAAVDPYSVRLTAVQQGDSVLVQWNRNAEAVKSALHGVLTITEGSASKQVKLDFPELRNGTVLYHRAGQQVSFRLDLHFKENRVFTENLTVQFPLQ